MSLDDTNAWEGLFGRQAYEHGQAAPVLSTPSDEMSEAASHADVPSTEAQAAAPGQGGDTYLLDSGKGDTLKVWSAGVPVSVWDEQRVWQHFIGDVVPGFKEAGQDVIDGLQTFLQRVNSQAVTDGEHCYTVARGGVVFCHPQRLAAVQSGPEALADQIGSEFEELVQRIEREEIDAKGRVRGLVRAHTSAGGFASDEMSQFFPQVNARQLCASLVDGLTTDKGRMLLGLDLQVTIARHEVRDFALADFDAAEERDRARRERVYFARRRGECVNKAEDDDGDNVAPPRVDWKAVCRLLVTRYSGQAAVNARYAEVADMLFSRLCLERRPFEIKKGRLVLEPYFRCGNYSWDQDKATDDTKRSYAQVFQGLADVYRERGDDPPAALTFYRVDQLEPNSTIELGPDIKLRTHVSCAKLILSESLANSLREFIASYRSQDAR